jgi:hypothetical protein
MMREFFAWWLGQLAKLLPQGLRRTTLTAVDAMVVKPVRPLARGIEAVAIGLRRNGRETPLGRFGLGTKDLAELPGGPPVGRPSCASASRTCSARR